MQSFTASPSLLLSRWHTAESSCRACIPPLLLNQEARLMDSPFPLSSGPATQTPSPGSPSPHSGCGSDSPDLGARPYTTPHQGALAFPPTCPGVRNAPTCVRSATVFSRNLLPNSDLPFSSLPERCFPRAAPWHSGREDFTLPQVQATGWLCYALILFLVLDF